MSLLLTPVAWIVLGASVIGLGAGEGAHKEVVLHLEGRGWGIRVAPASFEFSAPHVADDGEAVWTAGDGTDLPLIMKVLLQTVPEADDDLDCLARAEARLDLDSQEIHHVARSRRAGMPTVEYEVRQHGSVRVDQRNLRAFRFHDGTCTEIHISLMNYRSQHRSEFDRLLKSIELVEIDDAAMVEVPGAEP